MEMLVKKLASKISLSLGYDAEKNAVIAYGLLAIVQTSITIILTFLFGLLVHAPIEALIVCFAVSLYRKYSGGAHAYSANFCTVISVMYCTLAALLSRLLMQTYSHGVMLITIPLVYITVFWISYRYVPVDSPNKPITSEAKIRRMRRGSYIIISAYMALQLVFLILDSHSAEFQSYAISLLFGVSWQAFTLTPVGGILLDKLNSLPKF